MKDPRNPRVPGMKMALPLTSLAWAALAQTSWYAHLPETYLGLEVCDCRIFNSSKDGLVLHHKETLFEGKAHKPWSLFSTF